jgi:hypothetical protein
MDHHIGVSNQRVDGVAVQDVAPQIFRPDPAACGRIEGTARHPDDPLDFGRTFERLDRRDANVARRPRDGNCKCHTRWRSPATAILKRLSARQTPSANTACAAL